MVQTTKKTIGRIYPSLKRIQEVSAHIAAAVAEVAFKDGLAGVRKPANVLEFVTLKGRIPGAKRDILGSLDAALAGLLPLKPEFLRGL